MVAGSNSPVDCLMDLNLRSLRAGGSLVLDLRAENAPLERFPDALSLQVMRWLITTGDRRVEH